ncbi:MAG: hypothetical protein Q8M76_05745, partial [Spirochaetaceae bacterium]|nr:hypothetical protein [Spirochaetaceae bacterium]
TLRAAAGLDWSVGDLVAAAEYCFDGDPASGAPGIGSHNAYASLSWAAGDFLSLGVAAVAATATAVAATDDDLRWTTTAFAAWDVAQGTAATAYARAAWAGTGADSLRADAGLSLELKF